MKKSILLIDDEYMTRLIHEMLIKSEDPHAVLFCIEWKRGVKIHGRIQGGRS